MPRPDTIERFIARVEQNAHPEAIEEFYTEHASMRENQATPRVGRAALVENERRVLSRAKAVKSTCLRPVLSNGDYTTIHWIFEFDWKDGTRSVIEELAQQRWEGEQIAEERFFYDPAQMTPKQQA
jgi:hypothetical protein